MDVEMPTVETIRKMVQRNEGVAFLPHMCVEQDVEQDVLREVKVAELNVDRNIRLVYPAKRSLSHAAKAFLELVQGPRSRLFGTARAFSQICLYLPPELIERRCSSSASLRSNVAVKRCLVGCFRILAILGGNHRSSHSLQPRTRFRMVVVLNVLAEAARRLQA